MRKKCAIRNILNLDCQVGKQKKNVKINIDELSLNDLELLRIRTKIGESFDADVKDICSNHRYNLI